MRLVRSDIQKLVFIEGFLLFSIDFRALLMLYFSVIMPICASAEGIMLDYAPIVGLCQMLTPRVHLCQNYARHTADDPKLDLEGPVERRPCRCRSMRKGRRGRMEGQRIPSRAASHMRR